MKTTFHLALDDGERSMIIRSLNNLRSSLIAKGKYTDGVDDVLVKVIGAKKKKFKVIYTEDVDCDAGLEFHGEVVGKDGDLLDELFDQSLIKTL